MEKYQPLYELLKAHPDLPISILALVISIVSIIIVFRDRSNHIKVQLFTDSEWWNHEHLPVPQDIYYHPGFYVLLSNTGRTPVYVASARLIINKEFLHLMDVESLTIPPKEIDERRVLEPFQDRLYRISYGMIRSLIDLPESGKIRLEVRVIAQSGAAGKRKRTVSLKETIPDRAIDRIEREQKTE